MRAHSSYFRRKNSKKGLALSTAMAICIVLAILVALLVSMASLNITTTQATVNQREAYVQAKSAISFVESYYSKHGDEIPGIGDTSAGGSKGVGEGLVVFNTNNISEGADFYRTKDGLKKNADGTMGFKTQLIADSEIQKLKDNCPDTYVIVQNVMVGSDNVLLLEAHTKYGDNQAYSLKKQFTIGGVEVEENPFTGTPIYTGTANTRFVRFHVRATSAFGGSGMPYFYMWYNGISPAEGRAGHNEYVTSSIEAKLTYNRKYKEITNGSWGSDGPEAGCAMSYEGNGWYTTQKTFNMSRNVKYVNGIVTRTDAHRINSENEDDWDAQSFEFFGIPIPNETETGKENGVDVYFELVKNELHDMQNWGGNTQDALTERYRQFKADDGTNGRTQLNSFVKWTSQYYLCYVKTETAIMHYRKAGVIDYDAGICPTGFTYEGYGWYRRSTHDFSQTGPGGFSYTAYKPVSQNQYGKEKIFESFVVQADDGTVRQFETEEEANRWLVSKGDMIAGNYLTVNVNAAKQPVDNQDEHGAKIRFDADIYMGDGTVPTHPAAVTPTSASPDNEEPVITDLTGNNEELEFMKLGANSDYGSEFYVIGPEIDNAGSNVSWDSLKYKMTGNSDGSFSVEVDSTPYVDLRFWVIQRPTNLFYNYGWGDWRSLDTVHQNEYHTVKFETHNVYEKYQSGTNFFGLPTYGYRQLPNGGAYCNFWGDSANTDGLKSYEPSSAKVKITFTLAGDIMCEDVGEEEDPDEGKISDRNMYSVVGWMNKWGTEQDGMVSTDGTSYYSLTHDMEMYADIENVMTYSNTNITVRTGDDPVFMIAVRDAGISVDAAIDWTRVIDENGDAAQTSTDPANKYTKPADSVMHPKHIIVPPDDKGHDCDYYVTFLLKEQDGKLIPDYKLTPVDDIGKFYVIGSFNGWYPAERDSYEWTQASSYQMEKARLEGKKIVYTYKINSVQEGSDEGISYSIRVIGTGSRKAADPDGKYFIDYSKTWGTSVEKTVVRDQNGVEVEQTVDVSLGEDDVQYSLTKRSVVTVTFKYDTEYPEESEVFVTPDSEAVENAEVNTVFVGFHNDKLTNKNEAKNGKKSEFNTPWANVYATYYTEITGYNCKPVNDIIDTVNYWAKIPVDAEFVYFSNKPTNVYSDLHSPDFAFTDDIKNEEFVDSTSVIFFPIKKEVDKTYPDVDRTRWTVGDSKEYYQWVNTMDHRGGEFDMAYYGSTQCNYYDAPFVNVLNMLKTGKVKPDNKYCFASYPWSSFTVGGWEGGSFKDQWGNKKGGNTHNISFDPNHYVNYRGEKYYWTDITDWHPSCSMMLFCNPVSGRSYNENNDYMYGYLLEDQMSLETNQDSPYSDGYDLRTQLAYVSAWNGDGTPKYVCNGATMYKKRKQGSSSSYTTTDIDGMKSSMLMYNRAGGAFVSDFNYREGRYETDASGNQVWKQYESPFNYGDYTPTWYTFRIPVSTEVQIEQVKINTGGAWTNAVGDDGKDSTNTYKFEPIAESPNVNRAIYYFINSKDKQQVFTYDIKHGVVDGTANSSGDVTTSVYFSNCDETPWDTSKICVHAYTPTSEGVYLKAADGSDFYLDKTDRDRPTGGGAFDFYYRFDFNEGDYCFFQFFEGEPTAEGLKNAPADKKSKVIYLTGEELINSTDRYNSDYSGLDDRTTKILCQGSGEALGTGFTWYLHPRTAVMYAYLDMDTVNQMMTDVEYLGYNPSSGSYTCHGEVKIGSFGSRTEGNIKLLHDYFYNGNAGDHLWTARTLTKLGDGLLPAASDYIDNRSQARIFVSDDINDAGTSEDWHGPNYMVFMEGEQMEDSAFDYDATWLEGFKDTYKRLEKSTNSIYNRTMSAQDFRDASDDLRLWIENPVSTMKSDAIMVIVDNNRRMGRGGVNEKELGLYVKDTDSGWKLFTSELYTTTQENFYAFIFMLSPTQTTMYNQPFTVASSAPKTYAVDDDGNTVDPATYTGDISYVDKIGGPNGKIIKTQNISSGNRYRCNTYYDYNSDKYFRIDGSKETKTYTGTNIKYSTDNSSPTSSLNRFVGMQVGSEFQIHFKYDTTVTPATGGSYTIRAGYYEISNKSYAGFYSDFDPTATPETATKSGIDVYSTTARNFFTEQQNWYDGTKRMSYGMISAKEYLDWGGSRARSGKDLDIMTKKITASGNVQAVEPTQRVNFRWNGEKGKDTLTLGAKTIFLKGKSVSVAVNTIDFKGAGANDFIIESGEIEFFTDVLIKKQDNSTALVEAGKYIYRATDQTLDYYTVNLKTTDNPDTDWRQYFDRLSMGGGSQLNGGKFVAQ